MRRVCLLAGLLAAAAGDLCASSFLNCALSGLATGVIIPTGATSSGCWTSTFINATVNDSLDWGAPTTSGGLGAAVTPGNTFPVSTSLAVDARTTDGFGVGLQLAPDYSGTAGSLVRADNAALVWASHPTVGPARWVIPGSQGTPSNLALFAGNFNAPGPTGPPVQGASYGYPYGDHLVELQNGGPLELTFLNQGVLGVWFEISSLEGIDSNFDASVEAFDSSGNVLGTYSIQAGGSGGQCLSLSSNPPTPCNDAPYVGFYDPEGRIHSIYISVFDPSSNNLIGFAIDTLMVDEVPEPSMPLLVGSGLAAFSLWRRWRRKRQG
jgi:hypothetical protein